MNFTGLILDVTATSIYMTDYFRVLTDYTHILVLIKVRDFQKAVEVIRDHHENVHVQTIQMTVNMYSVSSKIFLPLLLMCLFGLLAIKSMWAVVSDNKRIQNRLRRQTEVNRSQ